MKLQSLTSVPRSRQSWQLAPSKRQPTIRLSCKRRLRSCAGEVEVLESSPAQCSADVTAFANRKPPEAGELLVHATSTTTEDAHHAVPPIESRADYFWRFKCFDDHFPRCCPR